jgi:hypothetical protein
MIPKRIFFYWSGNNLSWMRYMTLYSFRKYNPDWEVVLYLSDNNNREKTWHSVEEQDFINYNGINYLSRVEELNIKIEKVEFPSELRDKFVNISPVHESDLFRYYQLYKSGGFYCDMDVLFFRSMNPFYEKIVNDNIDTVLYQCPEFLAIGFLGSSVDNPFYRDLFYYGINNFNTLDYQSLGVDLIYKMYHGNRAQAYVINNISKRYPSLKIHSIPSELVYYFDWTKIDYNFTNNVYVNKFPKESIGYHWFGGSKTSQNHNNIMNEENFREFTTTFTAIAKKVLE